MRICVIILNRNLGHTLACLDALSKVSYSKFTKFVVDNGSSPGSVATLRAKHPHVLIERGTNVNCAIEWVLTKPFQWILLLSNEAIIDPMCLSAFMNQAKNSPDAKIFGAKILEPEVIGDLGGLDPIEKGRVLIEMGLRKKSIGLLSESAFESKFDDFSIGSSPPKSTYPEVIGDLGGLDPIEKGRVLIEMGFRKKSIIHVGGRWNAETATCDSFTTDRESQIVDYVSSKALLMHRSVPESIGGLEPRFRKSWEDVDYCFRARRKGFLTRTAPHANIWCPKEDPSFLLCDRLLWMQRNLTQSERKDVCKRVLYPERRKMFFAKIKELFRKNG